LRLSCSQCPARFRVWLCIRRRPPATAATLTRPCDSPRWLPRQHPGTSAGHAQRESAARERRLGLDIVDELIDLGARFPDEPEPIERAATIVAALPPADGAQSIDRWRVIAAFWTEVARRDPKNALSFVALGLAQERAGDDVSAEQAFASGVEVEPSCAVCLAHLAGFAHGAGHIEDAQVFAERARRADLESTHEQGRAREILSLSPDSLKILASLAHSPP